MVMKDGVVVEEGKTEDVINKPSDEYTRKLLNSIIAV
jgi:ABC-type dipeptide/oligopeptide/nickel transport system ATPase component